jgi:hypothetical protein
MNSFLEDEEALYVDLPGKCTSEPPPSILATSARTNMVLIRSMEITLIEFTVRYDSRENLMNTRARKSQKYLYLQLLGDLEAKGYSASLITCEISSLGPSPPVCLKATHELLPAVPRSAIRAMPCHAMFDAAAKIAISTF